MSWNGSAEPSKAHDRGAFRCLRVPLICRPVLLLHIALRFVLLVLLMGISGQWTRKMLVLVYSLQIVTTFWDNPIFHSQAFPIGLEFQKVLPDYRLQSRHVCLYVGCVLGLVIFMHKIKLAFDSKARLDKQLTCLCK